MTSVDLGVFGRAGAKEDGYFPADFGCPDCRGVVYVKRLGKRGFLSFRCRVGHVFSSDGLLEYKEECLDEALWTALELFDELVQLYGAFRSLDRAGKPSPGTNPDLRLERAVRHRRRLRALIRTEGAAPLRSRPKRRST